MVSQEKLDALYDFGCSRRNEEEARCEEEWMSQEATCLLAGAEAYAKRAENDGGLYYYRCKPLGFTYDAVPRLAERLQAQGFRVTVAYNQKTLAMDFRQTKQPPATIITPPKPSFFRRIMASVFKA